MRVETVGALYDLHLQRWELRDRRRVFRSARHQDYAAPEGVVQGVNAVDADAAISAHMHLLPSGGEIAL